MTIEERLDPETVKRLKMLGEKVDRQTEELEIAGYDIADVDPEIRELLIFRNKIVNDPMSRPQKRNYSKRRHNRGV